MPFERAIAEFRFAELKTEDAVLVELAEPTPLRRSPVKGSLSSWFIETHSGFVFSVCGVCRSTWDSSPLALERAETFSLGASSDGSSLASDRVFCNTVLDAFRCCSTLGAVGKKSANLLPDGRDMIGVTTPASQASSLIANSSSE